MNSTDALFIASHSDVEQPCFHCGLPVPANSRWQVRINNANQTMCCPGCQAVAQTIVDIGMESYYQHREQSAPGALPSAELVPEFLGEMQDWDNPDLQQPYVHDIAEHQKEITLLVNGITCAACAWLVEHNLKRQNGVEICQLNSSTHRARVVWNPEKISLGTLIRAIAQVGYKAEPYNPVQQEAQIRKENRTALMRLGLAGIAAMQVMMYSGGIYIGAFEGIDPEHVIFLRWVSGIVCTPVFFYSSWPFYLNAWRGLRARHLNMDVPVSLALIIAYSASWWSVLTHGPEIYFDSVSMFTFFLLLGRYFEMRMRHRSQQSSIRLSHHSLQTARRLDDDQQTHLIPADRLRAGDRVLVKAGEVIPGDGRVLEGNSAVDESMLTGEHLPRRKQPGDDATGGTLNIEQPLTLEILRNPADSTLSTLQRLLDRAEAEKPAATVQDDHIARYFIAAVLIVSATVFAFWWIQAPDKAFWITLSVLVVTCPCALSLATPTAITAATAALANRGFLATRSHTIETLRQITDVVFDKTGTLTEGHFTLAQTHPLCDISIDTLNAMAAALEQVSEHPIAHAFHNIDPSRDIQNPTILPNEGVQGEWNGQPVRMGKSTFAGQHLAETPEPPSDSGQWILLATDTQALAWFQVEDRLREDAKTLVNQLQREGKTCHVLSGDASGHAREIAHQLNIEQVHDNATPQDKLNYLQQLQKSGKTVLMLGDGLNDAPVLGGADVSIAMASGTDLAKVAADGVLLGQSLSPLLQVLGIVHKTHRIIRQNHAWALWYNVLALPAAAAGLIPPWLSAIGMSASSLIVVMNALRLNRHSPARAT